MDTNEIRKANIRRLAARTSLTDISKKLGYKQPSFLSQMSGPNPGRQITEKTARNYERKLGLAVGSLDVLPAEIQQSELLALQPVVTASSGKIVEDVISLIDATIAQEGVQLNPLKYANLVQFALADTLEHGGQVRGSHIQQMVKLLK